MVIKWPRRVPEHSKLHGAVSIGSPNWEAMKLEHVPNLTHNTVLTTTYVT